MTLNKAMLIGRLGKDPEVRYTKSGDPVASFSLATDDNWKDKQGNRQERTEWHNIVAWGKLADFAQNYLKKGRQVYVEGRIQTRDWTDNQSVKHYKTEVVANSIRFIGPNPDGSPRGGDEDTSSPARSRGGQGRGSSAPPSQPQSPEGDGEYIEDDIPF
jgi:single-strand DNA-binding protein